MRPTRQQDEYMAQLTIIFLYVLLFFWIIHFFNFFYTQQAQWNHNLIMVWYPLFTDE